jgi:hypothetical protein
VQAVTEGHSFSIRSCCSFFVTLVLCQVVKKDLWPSSQLKSTTHLSPFLLRAKMDRLQPFGNTDLNLDWYLLRRSTTGGRMPNVAWPEIASEDNGLGARTGSAPPAAAKIAP